MPFSGVSSSDFSRRRASTSTGTPVGGLCRLSNHIVAPTSASTATLPITTHQPYCSQKLGGIWAWGGRSGGISSGAAEFVSARQEKTPNSKHQTPEKHQVSPIKCFVRIRALWLGVWNFSGARSLEFAVFNLFSFRAVSRKSAGGF